MDWELDPLNPEVEPGAEGDENTVVPSLSLRQALLGQGRLFPCKPWGTEACSGENSLVAGRT